MAMQIDERTQTLTLDDTEEWRPVVGWCGLYEVSSHGRVRGLRRPGRPDGGQIALHLVEGYLVVKLCDVGKRTNRKVHLLVAGAFIGPRPDGLQTRHLDGNQLHNTPGNLRYGSGLENAADRTAHGHARTKLLDAEAAAAILTLRRTLGARVIAEATGANWSTIRRVGVTHWRHVKPMEHDAAIKWWNARFADQLAA